MIFRAINSDLDNLNGLLNKIWTLGIVWEGKGLRRSFYFFNSFCFQRKWKTRIFTKNFACYATFQVHFLGKKEDYLTFEIIKIFSLPSSPMCLYYCFRSFFTLYSNISFHLEASWRRRSVANSLHCSWSLRLLSLLWCQTQQNWCLALDKALENTDIKKELGSNPVKTRSHNLNLDLLLRLNTLVHTGRKSKFCSKNVDENLPNH